MRSECALLWVAVSLGDQGFCSLSLVPEEETHRKPASLSALYSRWEEVGLTTAFPLSGSRNPFPPHHSTWDTRRVSEFLPLNCHGLILYHSGWRKSSISPHVSREDLASGHHAYRTLDRCRPSSIRGELPACLFPSPTLETHADSQSMQDHRCCPGQESRNLQVSLNFSLDRARASTAPVSHAQWQASV